MNPMARFNKSSSGDLRRADRDGELFGQLDLTMRTLCSGIGVLISLVVQFLRKMSDLNLSA